VRVVASGQQIVRVDEEEPLRLPERLEQQVVRLLEKLLPRVAAVAVSDYAKGFITPLLMTRLHDLSRMNGVPVLVDPKPVNIGLFKGCDLLKPNRKEAAELSGVVIVDNATCDEAAARLLREYSPRALLITRGPDGMDLYREGEEPVRIRARVSRVYDVTGAGDTVLAALAMAYARRIDPVPACELAAAAAAVAVRKPGASTVSPEELVESIRGA
jgi:D-beta-D-heptose 7-phosphate kinase/D-beta-D-heptose 1-phosphate adenosyltransferase